MVALRARRLVLPRRGVDQIDRRRRCRAADADNPVTISSCACFDTTAWGGDLRGFGDAGGPISLIRGFCGWWGWGVVFSRGGGGVSCLSPFFFVAKLLGAGCDRMNIGRVCSEELAGAA